MISRWEEFDDAIARLSDEQKRELIERVQRSMDRELPAAPIGDSLNEFFGDWSAEEADAFDRAVAECRKIDPELWK